MKPVTWAIVVAGGSGSRMGGMPKQFRALGGATVLARSVRAMAQACDGVIVVANDFDACAAAGVTPGRDGVCALVEGGAQRRDSVAAGLDALAPHVRFVAVHDAARPLADPSLVAAGLAALAAHDADGAVPAIPVRDTIKQVRADGVVVSTLERERLVAVQTPQVFVVAALREAHATHEGDVTDDASLLEACGRRVVTFPGDVRNLKLTTPDDWTVAEAYVRAGSAGHAEAAQ